MKPSPWRPDEKVTAELSPCRAYRYWLKVEWPGYAPMMARNGRRLVVIGLNPSTADLDSDDQTVRKLANWAKPRGYECLVMLNAFAIRTKSPKIMKAHPDPYGHQQSAGRLVHLTFSTDDVVLACGADGNHLGRLEEICMFFAGPIPGRESPTPLYCFGVNKDGTPLHPCYARLPEDLIPYVR